ncbi:hypothetical protein [Lysobacter sp. A3-1-A15]|uniref:hypothetical protein n=1 Tax=Novilysobacter viscosus TaxID=3098602 RepID=UPI003983ADCF
MAYAAILLSALCAPGPAAAQSRPADSAWTFGGDLRGGYFATQQKARDGSRSDTDAFNARLRMSMQRAFNDRWTLRTRVAGRFSSAQDGSRAYLRGYAPTRTGAAFGDVTLDEAYIGYAAPDNGLRLKVGRFQTQFALPGVPSKGLDRNDSPNTDVNWTDGVHLDMPVGGGWRGHLVAEHRHARGSGGVARAPLDFSESGSRISMFTGLQNTTRWGPVDHRMVSVAWMPDSLARDGLSRPAREDYLTVNARVSATWPLRESGLRLVAGAEAGYAFNTPTGSAVRTGQAGDSDGLAWQAAASLYDIAPGHHLGVAYGRTGAGWLISPDFRNNDELVEIRYQRRFSKSTSMEARLRERRELEHPAGTRARVDHDLYVRVSHRF